MVTYNNPWAAQLADGLVKLFAPPAPQEMAALTQMQLSRAKGDREAQLWGMAGGDFDKSNIAIGNYAPTQSYYAQNQNDATDRYGYDKQAESERYKADKSAFASMFGSLYEPIPPGYVRPAVPAGEALTFGLSGPIAPAAGAPKPKSTDEVMAGQIEAAIQGGLLTPQMAADAATGKEAPVKVVPTPGAPPVYMTPGEAARTGASAYVDQGNTTPASVQEYEFAKRDGYTGTFEQWQARGKAPVVEDVVTVVGPDGGPLLVPKSQAYGRAPYVEPDAPREDPLVQVTGPNGNPIWVPRSQAAGQPAYVKPDAPQADPLVQVTGPNGNPIWVRQSQAAGMTPYIKPDAPRADPLVQVAGPNGEPIWVRQSQAAGQPAYVKPDAPRAEEYGTTPIWARDAQGNIVALQAGKDGTIKQSDMPPGVTIDFSIKPFETARGTELGQQAGEAAATAPMAEDKTQAAVSLIDSIITDKALPGITGMFQGRLPPMTQAGTNLNAKIDQLAGQAFLEAFNTLRGGGQITEIEGRKATDAMARLNRAQSPEAYIQALNDMKDVLLSGMARRQQKAMMGPSGGIGGPQPPPGTGNTGGGSGAVRVSSPEEARRLPSGTRIILPDGREGRVP